MIRIINEDINVDSMMSNFSDGYIFDPSGSREIYGKIHSLLKSKGENIAYTDYEDPIKWLKSKPSDAPFDNNAYFLIGDHEEGSDYTIGIYGYTHPDLSQLGNGKFGVTIIVGHVIDWSIVEEIKTIVSEYDNWEVELG